MNKTRRYEAFVWIASDDLRNMRDICLQSTWDDGHLAGSRISEVASGSIEESIRASDIFVCLFRTASLELERYCRVASASMKPLLLFRFSNNNNADTEELQNLIGASPEGSRFRDVAENACVFARNYLIALQGTVRTLDRINEPSEAPDPTYFPNRFFQRLTSRMSQWWVVDHRSHMNPTLKQAIADFVLDRYLRLLVGAGVFKLFFESGSSIALLSQAFATRLDDGWLKLWAEFDIETNNIFSYLEFLIAPSQRTSLYPQGPPDHKYGATFGRLLSIEPTENRDGVIADRAREVMEEFRDHFKSRYQEKGLIFAAASGIDWDRGPHVGSYPNMLFKRSQLESHCPTIILLDEDKAANPFNPLTCYAVCDQEFSWAHVRREVPLALACAFRNRENAARLEPKLRALGFRNIESGSRHHTPWCTIAANDKFLLEIEKWEQTCQHDDCLPRQGATADTLTKILQ